MTNINAFTSFGVKNDKDWIMNVFKLVLISVCQGGNEDQKEDLHDEGSVWDLIWLWKDTFHASASPVFRVFQVLDPQRKLVNVFGGSNAILLGQRLSYTLQPEMLPPGDPCVESSWVLLHLKPKLVWMHGQNFQRRDIGC